ncbi:MAG: 5'-3' exonuclease [Hyphomicrobiales bacterium]
MAGASRGPRSTRETSTFRVHLVDGTYELFRHYFAVPPHEDESGRERGAVLGVVQSLLVMLEGGATHVGVATDHVVESFRNDLYAGYKTGEGIEPPLRAQFEPLEEALDALGVTVWPMVEVEADDALAAAAAAAASDDRVTQVLICSPDKDLAQCVRGNRVVQLDRRKDAITNEKGVVAKFGVPPSSIADYLALVGDASDGYPGLPGWGAKTTATVLAKYRRLEAIPKSGAEWKIEVRGAEKLAGVLRERWDEALLFRKLATLRTDRPRSVKVDALEYRGPKRAFEALAASLRRPRLWERARAVADARGTSKASSK